MQFEGRRKSSHIPNLTPLIDIVFLLLVFFMLTSHFIKDEVINIDLPDAESGLAMANNEQIEIIVSGENEIILDGKTLQIEQLQQILNVRLAQRKDKVVRIRGDESVDLGIAIEVFDAARNAGATGVDIVTIDKQAVP